MSSDDFPATEPRGDLVPPPRKPPTAIAAATPVPPPGPRSRVIVRRTERTVHLLPSLAGFVTSLLQAADTIAESIADSIAEELGLRKRNTDRPAP